ncbi:hypothetical protein [Isoptericola nanjingensis]|uniref:hypothetical protein n=1 Tax=Isoptericola nanjingensis TaxID=903413 RepID=UPI003D19445E
MLRRAAVLDEAGLPAGVLGVGAPGTGARFGGHDADVEALTETQWVMVQPRVQGSPF